MARSYAHIYLTIWNDPDFRTLTPDGQWLYFVMLTHPTINSCGVIEWRESRLVSMATGMTPERLRSAAWELASRRMIAVDVTTEEALVRSFIRHDGVLKSPNITKGMVREHGAIASLAIMELVSREARRATEEEPTMKGSEFATPVVKQFMEPMSKGFQWVPEWFNSGSNSDTPKNGEGFQISSPVPTPYPLPPKVKEEHSTEVEMPKSTKRGTRLPEGWVPNVTGATEKLHARLDEAWINETLEEFRDHWAAESTANATKLDWESAWRNWLKRAIKWSAPKGATDRDAKGQTAADRAWQTPKRDPRFFPEDYAS